MRVAAANLVAGLRRIGGAVDADAMAATSSLYASLHDAPPGKVMRNLRYGAHARHACNLYLPPNAHARARPVVVFVHGGGYVRGDKELPGTPFYDNVGDWAARHDFIGVTANYRLAPAFTWPAASDDIADLVEWLAGQIAVHGGDPSRIFLVGHSAGATHVAACIARFKHASRAPTRIHGAVLCSGTYDLESLMPGEQVPPVYFGEDPATYRTMSPAGALAKLTLPVLYCVSELEPERFHRQGREAALRAMRGGADGRLRYLMLPGHNHFSPIFNLNLPAQDALGPMIASFIEATL